MSNEIRATWSSVITSKNVVDLATHRALLRGTMAAKLAQSWRGLTDGPIWSWYPGVIIVDKGGGNRQTYEVYVNGELQPRAQRLQEAKDSVEAQLGPCDWVLLKPEPQKVEHYTLGPTTVFTDPTVAYSAIPRT